MTRTLNAPPNSPQHPTAARSARKRRVSGKSRYPDGPEVIGEEKFRHG
jgi:hypothetical protein